MSLLNPSLIARKTKTTRPATIRPVPSTFGLGVIDDDGDDSWLDRYHAHLEAEMDAADVWFENGGGSFAAELVAAYRGTPENDVEPARKSTRKPRLYRVTPSTLDQAESLGYRLGRDGVEANPACVYNHRERAAFALGHERGLNEYHREEIAATEAFLSWRDSWYDGSDEPWNAAEFGSCLGHTG